ncbi:hypothetical protein [Marinobacter salexigens]|uniref:hypothetical protein n=1 Tax=Marinobacter salexigens TaxID=1925763 RepID=UPI000C286389|nr:hypothetical protein [Marinobacter salexigens]
MSDPANISADAIAALLGGLASALTDAQQTMAELPPADPFGRPLPSYRIPELDFTFEIETVEASNTSSSGKRWLLQPSGTSSSRNTISSTISGKIVAVPPNGGLPQTLIAAIQRGNSIEVRLSNSAGEILTQTPVELEFDAEASSAMHGTTLTSARRLALLAEQQTQTDQTGIAIIGIGSRALKTGESAIVLVRAAGAETRISLKKEA